MIELGVNQLEKHFGETVIFKNITFDIKTGERVGLIGANGTGKTTVMKMIMEEESLNGGEIFRRKEAKFGYLNQIPDYEEHLCVKDILELAFSDLYRLKEELVELEKQLSEAKDAELERLMKRYGKQSHHFEQMGGYMIDTEISKIAVGLSIDEAMLNQPFNKLSGGEQTRVLLGKILLERPDVLLLDEPSNHLDIESIEWLETYLETYQGAILIISHDRYFLDRVVTRILELTFDEAIAYHGNYTYYTVEKERRFLLAMKYYEQQQKKIKRMEEQIKRYRIWGEMRDSDKMYRRAKELEKRLEKMEKINKPVYENKRVHLGMNTISRTGKVVYQVEDIDKSFQSASILKGVSFELYYQDAMCILGGNGTGKTTLFKIMTGELEKDNGKVKEGSRINVGYLPQTIKFEDETMTIIEYFQSLYPITDGEARRELAKALFVKDDVFKKVGVLSGGEKSRLKLNTLMYGNVNVLLLDEPTNHLDIESREVLEENLSEFDGTLLFISHDRYFVDKLATRIGELKDGKLNNYNGDYRYYKSEKEKEAKLSLRGKDIDVEVKDLKPTVEKKDQEMKQEKKLSKNAKKRLEWLENEIESSEEYIESLEEKLIEFGHDPIKLEQQMLLIEQEKEKIEKLYVEWDEISI